MARDDFYTEAFTDPVTRTPYAIPADLREFAVAFCDSFGIRGICDPMYVANVAAMGLERGDGRSDFQGSGLAGDDFSAGLKKVGRHLSFAYSSSCAGEEAQIEMLAQAFIKSSDAAARRRSMSSTA